jgi:hypothetical protein
MVRQNARSCSSDILVVTGLDGQFVLNPLGEPFFELVFRVLGHFDKPNSCVTRAVGPCDLAFQFERGVDTGKCPA